MILKFLLFVGNYKNKNNNIKCVIIILIKVYETGTSNKMNIYQRPHIICFG